MKVETAKADRFLFVVNPIAGAGNKRHIPALIARLCETNQITHTHIETTGTSDEAVIEGEITSFRPKAVIALGGDGTSNLVGRVLLKTEGDITMGIIPFGSGNGLAKDLGIPMRTEDALEVIFQHHTIRMDALTMNGHPFFHISDIGFNARVVTRFSEKHIRGQLAYGISLFQEIFTYVPKKYKIITDTVRLENKAFLVAIANANQFGSNTEINPIGRVDDGQFEIVVMRSFPKLYGPKVFWHLVRNTFYRSRYSTLIRCNEADIINEENEAVQVDGELVEPAKKLKVRIHPKKLKVFVPAGKIE